MSAALRLALQRRMQRDKRKALPAPVPPPRPVADAPVAPALAGRGLVAPGMALAELIASLPQPAAPVASRIVAPPAWDDEEDLELLLLA